MSKTLPTAIQNGKSGDVEVVILVDLSTAPIGTYYWATRDIQVTDYEQPDADIDFQGGRLLEDSFGDIVQSVSVEDGGNVASRGGMSFKIANPQYTDTDRADQAFHHAITPFDFINREVKIWMAMTSAASVAYADLLLLYTGSILETKWNYAAYEFILRDGGLDRHKEIPDLTISVVNYPKSPDRNLGKVPGLIYGKVSGGSPEGGGIFAPPVMMSDQHHYCWIASRNKSSLYVPGGLFMYCQDVGVFLEVLDEISAGAIETYARPTTIKISSIYNVMGILRTPLRGMGKYTYPEGIAIENALDNDPNTHILVDSSSDKCFAKCPIPSGVAEVAKEDELYFLITFGSVSGTGKMCYWNPEYDAGTGAESTGLAINSGFADTTVWFPFGSDKTGAHGRQDDQSDEDNMWTLDELKTIEFGVVGDSGCSIQITHMALYLGGLVLRGGPANQVASISSVRPSGWLVPRQSLGSSGFDGIVSQDAFCAWFDGEKFGSWIDESWRDNPFNSGEVAEDAVYIIETLLRSELGLNDAKIDTESFDGIAGSGSGLSRQNWNRGGVVQGKKNSLDITRSLCREAGLIQFTNFEGKESITALSAFIDTVKTVDRTTILENGIRIFHTSQMTIYNEFELHYKKRWMPEGFAKMRYIKSTGTNMTSNVRDAESGDSNTSYTVLCSSSMVDNAITRKMTIESEWIRFDAEADKFLKWLAEWFCYKKIIVEIETAGWDHLELEIGDQVLFDHTLVPLAANDNDHFMLYDIRCSLKRNRMKMRFVQIPYLLP